jgi:hypothetical protein
MVYIFVARTPPYICRADYKARKIITRAALAYTVVQTQQTALPRGQNNNLHLLVGAQFVASCTSSIYNVEENRN